MASRDQLVAFIRFQLNELSARNGYHEFEHLCEELARQTVCSNILTATGPVSGGGDQGRDFETFRSYIKENSIANSLFIGRVSKGTLVFACSLEKNVKAKVKSDVNKILAGGTALEAIYFFSSQSVKTAVRHDLQEWAQKIPVHLEIFDAENISQLLALGEHFWITQQYLHPPSEIYPTSSTSDEDSWYTSLIERWRTDGTTNLTYAKFFALKAAIRHATSLNGPKQDLPFLISLLDSHIDDDTFPDLLDRRAFYEICIAALRGMGTLLGYEERIRHWFANLSGFDWDEFEDAGVLITYCSGASCNGVLNVPLDEIQVWHSQLESQIERELHESTSLGKNCVMLDLFGYAQLTSPLFGVDVKTATANAIQCWLQLTDIVEGAPLFPLDRFADRINHFIAIFPGIGEHEQYAELVHRVDELVAKRSGGFVAAEKCVDRALAFHQQGKILKAIGELQQSKVKWFANETLPQSIRCLIVLSEWYLELGLPFAAKYYALGAAYVALHAPDERVKRTLWKCLLLAAETDYLTGAWHSFFGLMDLSGAARSEFNEPFNIDDSDFERVAFDCATTHALTRRVASSKLQFVTDEIHRLGIWEVLEEFIAQKDEHWASIGDDLLWAELQQQMYGLPFSDAGSNRTFSWRELGITWDLVWTNDLETTLVVEQFIAEMQIAMVELAEFELALLPTKVHIEISLETTARPQLQQLPSNDESTWHIRLPQGAAQYEDLLSVFSAILHDVSVLPTATYRETWERAIEAGLLSKVYVGDSYSQVLRQFVHDTSFIGEFKDAISLTGVPPDFLARNAHEVLDWKQGPGPTYDRERSLEYTRNRYHGAIAACGFTLKRLVTESDFRAFVRQLRADKWLDWHVLTAVIGIILNWRVKKEVGTVHDDVQDRQLMNRMLNETESKDSGSPSTLFTLEKLIMAREVNMLASLRSWDLEIHQRTPDIQAIGRFLAVRYNYWLDDVDHLDPFAGDLTL